MTNRQKEKFWNTFWQMKIVLIIAAVAIIGGGIALLVSTSASAILGAKIILGTGILMLLWNVLGSYSTRDE